MVYAQIKSEKVINCIILDDESLLPLFQEGYDLVIRIDELSPRPGPGYSYISGEFSPPMAPQFSDE